jgi:hypothetical protein
MYPTKYRDKKNLFGELFPQLTPKLQKNLYIILSEPYSLHEVNKQIMEESELGKIMLDAIF